MSINVHNTVQALMQHWGENEFSSISGSHIEVWNDTSRIISSHQCETITPLLQPENAGH